LVSTIRSGSNRAEDDCPKDGAKMVAGRVDTKPAETIP
jgi:hypothetical protein